MRLLPWRRAKVIGSTEDPPPLIIEKNARDDELTATIIQRVLRPDDSAIDVGAHEGIILSQILRQSPHGLHHAFEPIPDLAESLQSRYPNVQVHQLALTDHSGRADYHHVVSNTSYSGLQRRRYDRPNEKVELITVDCAPLDEVLPEESAIRFVKIDVEGGELQVLRGGSKLLARSQPFVLFEHGLGAADHYGTRPEDVFDLLVKEIGLASVYLLEDWVEGGGPLSRSAFIDEFWTNRNWMFLAASSG